MIKATTSFLNSIDTLADRRREEIRNTPDTIAPKLNRIVNELATNDTPDYAAMLDELQQYSDDARALNLMGVIEYRRHKRGAAKKAFTEAAMMGDEQAMTNLMIISR